jgi:hypothetical protein
MSKKSILFAAAAGVVTLAGGVTAASAHGHGGPHGHFFHHGFGPRIIIGGYGYSDCGYLYSRWQYTGSRYWRHRYFQCRNGW